MAIASLKSLRVLIWGIAALSLLLACTAVGWLGTVKKTVMSTNFRSEVGAQEPSERIVIEGVSMAYTDSGGTGPVIICLHAIGHGARDFENVSRQLSPDYRVIALDFPQHGSSGYDPRPPSATRYAEILGQFIEQLHPGSVTLLGNSIGGAAAIRYASQHPEHVKALVLCDSAGLGVPDGLSRLFIGAFVQFFAAGRRGAIWFPWAFSRYYSKVLVREPAREQRDRIVRSAYEIAPILERAWRSFAKPEELLLPILSQVQCPVLLAWAKDDFVLPLSRNQPSFQKFTNHCLEVFEGGHAAFLEDPDRFASVLRRFLCQGCGTDFVPGD
jgi:pimeloyl-ACP methyl ester carboxylesterase